MGTALKKIKFVSILLPLIMFLVGCGTTLKKVQEKEKRGLFYDAAKGYVQLYSKTNIKDKPKRALFANGAGRNFLSLGQYEKAYNYLSKSIRFGVEDSLAILNYADCLMAMARYNDALAEYRKYLSYDSLHFRARIGERSCTMVLADTLLRHRQGYVVRKVDSWNSSKSDFAPFLSYDGSQLLFTSNRRRGDDDRLSMITGMRNNDIYMVVRDASGVFSQRADTVGGALCSVADEGVTSLSKDGLTMYYTKSDTTGKLSVYKSLKNRDNQWDEGERIFFFRDSNFMTAHPSISPSGNKIVFVSDAKGSIGSTDIYMCDIVGEKIGEPYNLGLAVNTPLKECYPYLANDSLLFFSSNGHVGYGGLDIYKAVLLPNGSWHISNMGRDINSSKDDYGITFSSSKALEYMPDISQDGYFSSNRDDARGCPHLYHFYLKNIQTIIEGYVMDRDHYAIEGARVRVVGNGVSTAPVVETKTNEGGYFKMNISDDIDYVMLASAKGYLSQYVRFKTDSVGEDAVYSVEFVLSSKDHPEVLHNIYYAFDSSVIDSASYPVLNDLVRIMADNPDIRVLISSHADRFGSDAYNMDLSNARARSVVDYLVSKGIDKGRLESKGYGKSKPYIVSKSIAERYDFLSPTEVLSPTYVDSLDDERQSICDQLNRRTEFVVIK